MNTRTTKHRNSRGFSVVSLLAVLAAAAIVAVEWYLYANTTDSRTSVLAPPGAVAPPGAAAPLKIYSNSEYGFSFQYPSIWKLTEDLHDLGRGHQEGDITVRSPAGMAVVFTVSLGGKGGSCAPAPGDTPHHTVSCSTLDILTLSRLAASRTHGPLYLYNAKYTPPGPNAQSKYVVFVANGLNAPTATGPIIGAVVDKGVVQAKVGYVYTALASGDDTVQSYFSDPKVTEAADVLKSFRLSE